MARGYGISFEERKRRSDQAKRLLREGKLGANSGGGRPSKLRTKLSKEIAEAMTGMSEDGLALALPLLRVLASMSVAEMTLVSHLLGVFLQTARNASELGLAPDGKPGERHPSSPGGDPDRPVDPGGTVTKEGGR